MATPVVPVPREVLVPEQCHVAVEASSQCPGKEQGLEIPRDIFFGTCFTRVRDGEMDSRFHAAAGSPGVS